MERWEVRAGGELKVGSFIQWNRKIAIVSAGGGTVYLLGRDGCWQQFHTKCSIICAPVHSTVGCH